MRFLGTSRSQFCQFYLLINNMPIIFLFFFRMFITNKEMYCAYPGIEQVLTFRQKIILTVIHLASPFFMRKQSIYLSIIVNKQESKFILNFLTNITYYNLQNFLYSCNLILNSCNMGES